MYHKLKYITLLLNHIMQCEYTVLDRNSEVGKGCNFTVLYRFFFLVGRKISAAYSSLFQRYFNVILQ